MLISYIRTILLYLILLLSIRLMGKRQLGQLEPSEFVVAMLVADLASIPMQDISIPLYMGLVPIFTVLGAELFLSGLCLQSIRIRKFFCGQPVILIENGHLLQSNLRRTRISIDELMGHLRQQQISELQMVQYAILETDGNISFFPYPSEVPPTAKDLSIHPKKQFIPVTVISDGRLLEENLHRANRDSAWVTKTLANYRTTVAETFLLTVDPAGHVYWLKKEGKHG